MIWIVAAIGVFVFLGFIGILTVLASGWAGGPYLFNGNHPRFRESYQHHVYEAGAPVDEYRRAQERGRA